MLFKVPGLAGLSSAEDGGDGWLWQMSLMRPVITILMTMSLCLPVRKIRLFALVFSVLFCYIQSSTASYVSVR